MAKSQLRMKIIGPPGTGKTTTLLELIHQELDEGLTPDLLGLVTFTKNAAEEAKVRSAAKFNLDAERFPHIRTIHSACYRLLHVAREQVPQYKDISAWGKQFGWSFSYDVNTEDGGDGLEVGDWLLGRWDLARNRHLIGVGETPLTDDLLRTLIFEQPPPRALHLRGGALKELQLFIAEYEGWKRRGGRIDFADMLLGVLRQGLTLPLISLFVDEGQDLSPLQWAVVDQWSRPCRRVYAAGDEDQAIMGFQGGAAELFLNWRATRAFILPKTYRLPRAVHALAEGLITRNERRVAKDFLPRDEEGAVCRAWWDIRDLPLDQGSWFLLARNRQFVRELSGQCLRHGIPYTNRRGMSPLAPGPLMRAVVALWRLHTGEGVSVADLAMIYEHIPSQLMETDAWGGKRHAGRLVEHGAKAALRRLVETRAVHADTLPLADLGAHGLTPLAQQLIGAEPFRVLDVKPWHQDYLARVARTYGLPGLTETPKVTVSTIHGVKGEEADHVYIASSMSGRTAEGYRQDPESERRVWYVGATRARHSLHICRLPLKGETCFAEWGEIGQVNHAAD